MEVEEDSDTVGRRWLGLPITVDTVDLEAKVGRRLGGGWVYAYGGFGYGGCGPCGDGFGWGW